jgi:hypothetical protein
MFYLRLLHGQWWSNPVNFGISNANDLNPHACRGCVDPSCLVWESDVHGNWDIVSRFVYWGYLTDTFSITIDTNVDVNAKVAIDYTRNRFWCVWQSDRTGNWDIFIAYGDSINGWSTPIQLSTDTLEDCYPSVYVNLDTVWVVWNSPDGVANIYYDGGNWSSIKHIYSSWISYDEYPCINGHYNHPLAAWSFNNNIYFSQCTDTSWSFPQRITNDDLSKRPEICSEVAPWYNTSFSAWITWQCSVSVGNWEIKTTEQDDFNTEIQLTDNNFNDITPNPLYYLAIGEYVPPVTVFCSDSNGNKDISAYWMGWGVEPVDTNSSDDSNPVLTQSSLHLWVFWQTDRNSIKENGNSKYIDHGILRATLLTGPLQLPLNRSYKIFDITGRQIHTLDPAPGIYFIQVDDKIVHKVVKVR